MTLPDPGVTTPPTDEQRLAPVQGRSPDRARGYIAWSEHLEAFAAYSAKYGNEQSAERIAERGGFSYSELELFLDHKPMTWFPR